MSDSCVLPQFETTRVASLAAELYGLEGSLRLLHGERDLNFLVDSPRGRFVFKIANSLESPAMLECQHEVFERLADAAVFPTVATALESNFGRKIETVVDAEGRRHACRVLPFIEGRLLGSVDTRAPAMLRDLGGRLAQLDTALNGYSHAALERPLLWKMDDVESTVARFAPLLASDSQRRLIMHFLGIYHREAGKRLGELRRGVIHNDANGGNVLLDDSGTRVVSIIDFGDMIESWLAVEVAIAATYAMLEQQQPLRIAQQVVAGYHAQLPLHEAEINALFGFICMRLCMSVCVCAHQRELEPDNEYLSSDEPAVWALLGEFAELDYAAVREILFAACAEAQAVSSTRLR